MPYNESVQCNWELPLSELQSWRVFYDKVQHYRETHKRKRLVGFKWFTSLHCNCPWRYEPCSKPLLVFSLTSVSLDPRLEEAVCHPPTHPPTHAPTTPVFKVRMRQKNSLMTEMKTKNLRSRQGLGFRVLEFEAIWCVVHNATCVSIG